MLQGGPKNRQESSLKPLPSDVAELMSLSLHCAVVYGGFQ